MTDSYFWETVGSDFSIKMKPFDLLREDEERVFKAIKKNMPSITDKAFILDYICSYEHLSKKDKNELAGITRCTPKEFYGLCCKWRDIHALRLMLADIAKFM